MNAESLTFSEDAVAEHEVEYTLKVAELCRKKGIKLIWITIPSTMAEIYSVSNYQDAVDYLTAFCAQTGYPYINFSLLRDREELFPDTSFSDHIHLSYAGAGLFSEILAETIRKVDAGEDISSMFYASVDEMKKDVDRIPGCFVYVRKKNDCYRARALSVQNEDITPEYRLLIKKSDMEWQVLADWQESVDFTIPLDAMHPEDDLRIETRQKGRQTYDCFWEQTVRHALNKKKTPLDSEEEGDSQTQVIS